MPEKLVGFIPVSRRGEHRKVSKSQYSNSHWLMDGKTHLQKTSTVSNKIAIYLDIIVVFDMFGVVHLQVAVDGSIKIYIYIKNNQPTPFQAKKHKTT